MTDAIVCEPDCKCRCDLTTCACRQFRIPLSWFAPAERERWEAEPGHAWRSLWRYLWGRS